MVITLDSDHHVTIEFDGRGTMGGVRAFVQILDEIGEIVPEGERLFSLMDCRRYKGTPLRAQLTLARWLMLHRSNVGQVAVVGARPWEERLGRAVMKLANMSQLLGFFSSIADARRWLDWDLPTDPRD